MEAASDSVAVSAVLPSGDGAVLIRGYEVSGKAGQITLSFHHEITSAKAVNLFEKELPVPVHTEQNRVTAEVEAYSLFELKVR